MALHEEVCPRVRVWSRVDAEYTELLTHLDTSLQSLDASVKAIRNSLEFQWWIKVRLEDEMMDCLDKVNGYRSEIRELHSSLHLSKMRVLFAVTALEEHQREEFIRKHGIL